MPKKRLLITGGTGLLGLNWACAMRDRFDVVITTHRRRCSLKGVSTISVQLDNGNDLSNVFKEVRPATVVHTVGMANVDDCEAKPETAKTTNTILAGKVAKEAGAIGAQMIHISTDHLFDGEQKNYTEESMPSPINIYAETKLLAEKRVAEALPSAIIVRTNFFGWGSTHRRSFSDWILDTIRSRQSLNAFQDVFFSPILIDRLVKYSHKISECQVPGIYNIVGDERLSKYDFALRLIKGFGLSPEQIVPGSVSDVPLKAPRPRDMSLSNEKARKTLGCSLGKLEDYIFELKRQELVGRRKELLEACL